MGKNEISPATTQSEPRGPRLEIINWTCERDAFTAAREATLAGLLDIEVVRRPARGGPVWGYSFSARLPKAVWVVEGPEGEWLSEEEAANEIEAVMIYHATGGTNGFFARPLLQLAGVGVEYSDE